MEAEFPTLKGNGTWTLTPPVSSVNLMDSQWVFKVKLYADGSIERYKAHLVALKDSSNITIRIMRRLAAL
jgi:hypothetical protein